MLVADQHAAFPVTARDVTAGCVLELGTGDPALRSNLHDPLYATGAVGQGFDGLGHDEKAG
jgi:hypothetical protein